MSCYGLRRMALSTALRCGVLATGVLLMMATATRADPAKATDSMNAQTTADAQCLVIGAQLSGSADPREKMPGQMILMYYLGRIDGRTPNADLKTLITSETRHMTVADVKSAASRCDREFSARGDEIVRIGKSLGKPAK